jgi:hypothetical protein
MYLSMIMPANKPRMKTETELLIINAKSKVTNLQTSVTKNQNTISEQHPNSIVIKTVTSFMFYFNRSRVLVFITYFVS